MNRRNLLKSLFAVALVPVAVKVKNLLGMGEPKFGGTTELLIDGIKQADNFDLTKGDFTIDFWTRNPRWFDGLWSRDALIDELRISSPRNFEGPNIELATPLEKHIKDDGWHHVTIVRRIYTVVGKSDEDLPPGSRADHD